MTSKKNKIYSPREDSFLLLEEIKKAKLKKSSISLDVGTGSGILSLELSKHCKKVYAIDINKDAISNLKLKIEQEGIDNISVFYSDLFKNLDKKIKFDLIVFNPPYIPVKKILFLDLDGGKNGTEIIEKFLIQAKDYLKKEGKIILLTSSLNKNIEKLFNKLKYNFKKLSEKKIFFEKLYTWELTLS